MRTIHFLICFSLLGVASQAEKIDRQDMKCITAPMYYPGAGVLFDRQTAEDVDYLNPSMLRMEFINEGDAQGTINYAAYDYVVREAGERGLEVLGLIDYSSIKWSTRDEWSTEDFRDRFALRVQEIVTHYSQFEYPIRHWEIWNEQDIEVPNFDVRIEPEPYGLLLARAYDAIKAIDSRATVVLGGISPKGLYYGENYLEDLYATNSIQNYRTANGHYPFDVVAVHPYPETFSNPNPALGNILESLVKDVMNANGDRHKKVWLTEMGWSSFFVTEQQQASYMESSFHLVDDLIDPNYPADPPYVEKYFWFQYVDFSNVDRWGLWDQGRTRKKPCYFTFLDLTDRGPEPSGGDQEYEIGPGEEPPVWNATSDTALPYAVSNTDLANGIVPAIVAGGFHEANVGTAANMTNGVFDSNGVTLVLADYASPSIRVSLAFPEPVDVIEVRSFAGHFGDTGNRSFQSFDVYVDGELAAFDLTSGEYGQTPPGQSGVSLVRWLAPAGQSYVARGVETLEVAYYPVSTLNFDFRDRWSPVDDPDEDLDGRGNAYVSTIVKEIDVIGHPSNEPVSAQTWMVY